MGFFIPSSIIVERYLDLCVIIYRQAGSSLSAAFLDRTLLKDVVREHVDFFLLSCNNNPLLGSLICIPSRTAR